MATATHTLSGDFGAIVGEVKSYRAVIRSNSEDGSWIDPTGEIKLGGSVLADSKTNPNGVFEVPLPTSTGTGLQYHVDVSYHSPIASGGYTKSAWASGWFDHTADQDLRVAAQNSSLHMSPLVADTLDARVTALEADSGVGDALTSLIAQVNGYNNLGDVSGAVTVQPVGTQVMNVTGPTTISIASGHANGESFTLLIRSGGDDVTWASSIGFDAGDPSGDIISVTFMRVEGFWTSLAGAGGGGGEVVVPVNDPPTQPGTVTVDPTADGYVLTWVASTVAAGYEVQIDGGAWVDSGANTTHTFTGLTSGSSHSGAVRAYNSLGTKSTTRAWGPASVDTMSFDAQIAAYNPLIYVHGGDGTVVDLSDDTSSAWTTVGAVSGALTPLADGPPLLPGDTASIHWRPNSQLVRAENGITAGLTSFTGITVVRSPAPPGTYGSFTLSTTVQGMSWGAAWDFESYSRYKIDEQHIVFDVWDGTTIRKFYDTDSSPTGSADNYVANPTVSPGSPFKMWMHGDGNGGSGSDGGFMARCIVLPNIVLSHAQRVALCESAGYPS